jgi:hypothetical protein
MNPAKLLARLLVLLIIVQPMFYCLVYADETGDPEQQYRDITKRILLQGIEIERFSLNYRLAGGQQPKFRRLRYFLSQEAGAAGGMAFELVATDQLKTGRKRPLKIDTAAIKDSLKASLVTSIIAGSGSGLELASNSLMAMRNKKRGYDSRGATEHVASEIKILDELLEQREALVEANKDHAAYDTAKYEGTILREMRIAMLYEYGQFNRSITRYRTYENIFYAFNIPTNVIGAISSYYGVRGVANPKFNGPSNMLFVISGALTTVSPLLSTVGANIAGRIASHRLSKLAKEEPYNPAELSVNAKRLEDALQILDPTGTKYPSAVWRASEYTKDIEQSSRQLRNEARLMNHLEQVAVQSNVIGPPIGGTLLAQGILGTVGHYQYGDTLKELDLNYKGAVTGLVGTSTAVGVTAAGYLAGSYYFHQMKKKNRLPRQIIGERLKFLDGVEKTVKLL